MLLLKVKLLADGTEERVKARAVLLGNDYRPGVDFGDNKFAPCAQIRTARMMVADAVQHRKCVKSCDAKQAFTNGQAERRVFIDCPPGRAREYDPDTGAPLCYEITKNCYGSPTAPRQWNIDMHNSMISFGFEQRTCDQSLYTCRVPRSLCACLYRRLYVNLSGHSCRTTALQVVHRHAFVEV